MAISALGGAVVAALVSGFATHASADAYAGAKKLWDVLWHRFGRDRRTAGALDALSRNLSNPSAQSELASSIDDLAAVDQNFRYQMHDLVQQFTYVDQSVNSYVDDSRRTYYNSAVEYGPHYEDSFNRYDYRINTSFDLMPSPAGRLLMFVGTLICVAGLLAFAYPALSFILVIFTALQQQSTTPPDFSQVQFVPWIPVGFITAVAGMLVVLAGMLMRRRRPA
jgi:hypothetical protein